MANPVLDILDEQERKRKQSVRGEDVTTIDRRPWGGPTGNPVIDALDSLPVSETVGKPLEQLASGLTEGIADLVGLPCDIVLSAIRGSWDSMNEMQGTNYAPPDSLFLSSDFNKAWLRKSGLTAREAEDSNGKILRFAGSFISSGGIGAVTGAGRTAGKVIARYSSKAKREALELDAANKSARAVMEQTVSEPEEAAKRLTAAADKYGIPAGKTLVATHPGIGPSTAQLMGDPGLIGLENLVASNSAVAHSILSDRRVRNMVAINDMYEGLAPHNVSVEGTRNLLKSKVSVAVESIESRMAAYKEGIDDLVNQ